MITVTIFDYGAGNLHSLAKAVAAPGVVVRVEGDPEQAVTTDALIFPGVGAFSTAADRIAPARARMCDAIRGGLPTLGVCLGMQLLFDGSDEGEGAGLGLIPGRVTRVHARRTPHMGWNSLDDVAPAEELFGEAPLALAYFANGYACRPETAASCVTAWTTHEEDRFPAAVRCGTAVGVQFHPEKSSRAGVTFVRAFVNRVRESRLLLSETSDSSRTLP